MSWIRVGFVLFGLPPALLFAGSEASVGPEYPLGRLRFPSLTQPARPLRLADLRYRLSDQGDTSQFFEARMKLGAFAFFGGEISDDRRGLFFDTQRLEFGATEEEGRYTIEGAYRFPRVLVAVHAEKRPESEAEGWVLDSRASVRLNADFELSLDYLNDTNPARSIPLATRPLRRGSIGLLYQRGNYLDVEAHVSRSRIRTEGGVEFDTNRTDIFATLSRSRWEIESRFGYEQFKGRLRRNQALANVRAAFQLASRVVVHGLSYNQWEPGVRRFEREAGVGVTLYARRHTFARSGEAAELTLGLTRRAYELGYNERRVYDLDGLRALRERMALSPARGELADAIDALFRTQVRDRNVPQLGFEITKRTNDLDGAVETRYRGLLGIPWRLRWPFQSNAESVEFVQFHFAHIEQRFLSGSLAVTRELGVEVTLSRETTFRVRYIQPGRTPTEIVKLANRPKRIDMEFSYALGR